MINTMTAQRIKELLDDIRRYEDILKQHENHTSNTDVAIAWATLALRKAQLTSMKGNKK